MTAKLKIIILVIVILMVLAAVLIGVLVHRASNNIPDGPDMTYRTQTQPYRTDNLLELHEWLGKNPQQAGLDDKYVDVQELYDQVKADGMIFGVNAYATAYFSNDRDTGARITDTVYITVTQLSFDACRQQLIALYGDPTYEAEDPYVESLGGAVTHCDFTADGYAVKMSQGSEHEYLTIELTIR